MQHQRATRIAARCTVAEGEREVGAARGCPGTRRRLTERRYPYRIAARVQHVQVLAERVERGRLHILERAHAARGGVGGRAARAGRAAHQRDEAAGVARRHIPQPNAVRRAVDDEQIVGVRVEGVLAQSTAQLGDGERPVRTDRATAGTGRHTAPHCLHERGSVGRGGQLPLAAVGQHWQHWQPQTQQRYGNSQYQQPDQQRQHTAKADRATTARRGGGGRMGRQ